MELRERSERSISLKHGRAEEAVEKKSTFQELHVYSQNAIDFNWPFFSNKSLDPD